MLVESTPFRCTLLEEGVMACVVHIHLGTQTLYLTAEKKNSSSWVVAFQECSTLPPSFCIVCITCVEVTAELIGEKVSYTQNQIILDPGSAWNKVTIPKALLWQHILETRQFVSASIWFRLVYWRLLLQWLLVKSNQKQIMLQMETIKLLDRSKKNFSEAECIPF